MARGKLDVISQEDELQALRNKVAELERDKEENATSSYLQEVQKLKKATSQNISNVSIKAIQGDKHISLWHVSGHNVGKRIGPIHPASAEDVFIMFAEKGIKISTERPKPEWIEKYMQSEEYKRSILVEQKRRDTKNRSKKESQIEKLTNAIAKSQGIDPTKLNAIKEQHEVGV